MDTPSSIAFRTGRTDNTAIIQIKALAEGEFTVGEKKKSLFSFVQGAITFVNPQTGAVERSQLSLPYVTNWE